MEREPERPGREMGVENPATGPGTTTDHSYNGDTSPRWQRRPRQGGPLLVAYWFLGEPRSASSVVVLALLWGGGTVSSRVAASSGSVYTVNHSAGVSEGNLLGSRTSISNVLTPRA